MLAPGVRHPHRDAVARRPFVVQPTAVCHGDHTRRRIDRKPAPRRIREAVRLCLARVGIHPRRRPYHRPRRGVLCYGAAAQRDVRGSIVHGTHCDVGCRVICSTISICNRVGKRRWAAVVRIRYEREVASRRIGDCQGPRSQRDWSPHCKGSTINLRDRKRVAC